MVDDCAAKQQTLGGTSRERYWSEIGIEEKAERIRRSVKSLQGQVNRLAELIDGMEDHSHSDGKMVIPFSSRRWNKQHGEDMGRGPGKDDVYF